MKGEICSFFFFGLEKGMMSQLDKMSYGINYWAYDTKMMDLLI